MSAPERPDDDSCTPERPDGEQLHPEALELTQYLRGGLSGGHAVAVLAHALVCGACGLRLMAALQGGDPERLATGSPRVKPPDEV